MIESLTGAWQEMHDGSISCIDLHGIDELSDEEVKMIENDVKDPKDREYVLSQLRHQKKLW